MLKRTVIFLISTLLLFGCASKQSSVVSEGIPSKSYKDELAEYERSMAAAKPSPSLWANHGTLFLDNKARLVGDIVIVKIVESSSARNSNNTSTNKSASYDASIDSLAGIPTDLGMRNFLNSGKAFDPTISASTANSWSGAGSKARSDTVSATVAARIVEVLPSGNLVIEGQREIIIDDEKQTMTVRGIIRQKDIDASNTVLSSAIADAQISYSGDGVLSDANRKGWLARFIDWVWPF